MKYRNKISSVAVLFIAVLMAFTVNVSAKGEDKDGSGVILGGIPFGVSFTTGELKIRGFDDIETENGVCSPAKDAGLMEEDVIKKIDGKEVKSALELTVAVRNGRGEGMKFDIVRNGADMRVEVFPVLSKQTGDYRLGLWLEDDTAGLGTVTYIEEKSGKFGGLGHGIVEADTGEITKIGRGIVSEVEITGVNKGKAGEPGELKGDFLPDKLGVVNENKDEGVFGYITEYPEGFDTVDIELGTKEELKNGGASVFCTVDGGGVCEYGVEITRLEGESGENKNFLITVTDTSLIEKTGGIVRGMSGSPVVQDGKLVGAVTHVLVDDPTRGYGIFIENMVEAAG